MFITWYPAGRCQCPYLESLIERPIPHTPPPLALIQNRYSMKKAVANLTILIEKVAYIGYIPVNVLELGF